MKTIFNQLLQLALILLLVSCSNEKELLKQAELECMNKTKIDGFNIAFFGYFPKDADSINIKIKRNGKLIDDYNDKIPNQIQDSSRQLRSYTVNKEINLTDTVFLKIKNEPSKVITDFKYLVRPHFSMMSKDYGCDFYELKIDGKTSTGDVVNFQRKNWKIIEKKNFKTYYSGK